MKTVNASIITIGDELLIGQTIDTNSAFIAQELNRIGVWVKRRVAVGDLWDDIWQALDDESENSEIIIITGGLGPTADDITKPLLCKYFGGKLVVNEDVLKHVQYLFEQVYRRPGAMLERNLKQAEVPDVCTVLHNKRGTAPGMWFGPPTPRRGDLDPDSSESHFRYETADPMTYRLLKQYVSENRSRPTEAERVLWEILKGKKLTGQKFRRQHIIGSYIADFVCLAKKLIIEVDGLIHQLPENTLSDEARTAELNKLGFEVVRFTNDQILYDADTVLDEILAQLKKDNRELSASKNPPSGGRGAGLGAVFISLPGVPHEMKGLMIDEVIPRLLREFEMPAILHRTAFTSGVGESMIAEHIKGFESALPPHIKLAYLPGFGMVKLRLTATGDNKIELEKQLDDRFEQLKLLVKEWLVADTDDGLEVVVGKILIKKNKTVGTAESCTGGYIAHLITSVAGSSAYYKGSVVSYANEVKEAILGVQHVTLESLGAVSEETVKQMIKGAIEKLNVDYAVATSGIMGPDGGSKEKPVGMVWIAAGNKDKLVAKEFHFRFDRERNIRQTAHTALDFLRKFILANG
ncbi:MAG: nicotinamide-nucleotide amidohydrolase family protein [Chitinophagales bacterium]